ncbi:MAG: H-NS histone family protein [Zoogloeaceae bacterium]|nr:H-NS histone family protein [Zoogloeaceae bacterium]
MDISRLSLMELKALERQIPREIRRRSAEEKGNVKKKLEKLALESGFTLAELTGGRGRRGTGTVVKRQKLPPKYRHPKQSELVWSGKGRKPAWVNTWIAGGGKLEQLAI